MSEAVRTVTRFQNGYVVYGNPDCVRTLPRGALHLVWNGSASSGAVAPAAPSQKPTAGAVLQVSIDPMVEAGARTLVAWLEDKYAENMSTDFGSTSAEITVPNLPPQEVVNMAMLILRQRGFRVETNYPATGGPTRTAIVNLRPASRG